MAGKSQVNVHSEKVKGLRKEDSSQLAVSQTTDDGHVRSTGTLEDCTCWSHRAFHLCDMLETLADDLPRRTAPFWREVEYQSKTFLFTYFRAISGIVIPTLLTNANRIDGQEEVLRRLQEEAGDRLSALQDLTELFTEGLHSPNFKREPEALGYALRGHFEAIRKDVLWHMDVLWPMAARHATEAEISEFSEALREISGRL